MRSYQLIALWAALLGTPAIVAAADPDYVATVQKAYAPDANVRRVAVAPIVCPADLDCDDLEKQVAKLLDKRAKLQVITAEETLAMMQRANISSLDFESRYILAEGLKADAIISVNVQKAGTDLVEGELVQLGQEQVRAEPKKVKQVKLAVEMATKDGTTLLQASGEAKVQSMMRSLDSIAGRTLDTVFEQALPTVK